MTIADSKPVDWVYELPIKTPRELYHFVQKAFGVSLPRPAHTCPGHVSPWVAFRDAYFCKSPVSVWKASRGLGGKSYLAALLGLTEAVTLKCDVNILGGSGEQAKRVNEYMARFRARASEVFIDVPVNEVPDVALFDEGEATQRIIRPGWGNQIQALMASQASVRGPHPAKLIGDEIDEVNIDILDSAMGQPLRQVINPGTPAEYTVRPHTVLSSTHQYADGTMTEVLRRAAEKGWNVSEWCMVGNTDIMTPNGPVKIKDLAPGSKIYAFKDGSIIRTETTDAWCSGIRQTVIVRTTAGTIECTPDHRIRTPDGWREAGRLRSGQIVLAVWPSDSAKNAYLAERERLLWEMLARGEPELRGNQNRVPDMWPEKAGPIKDLSKMLPAGTIQAECAGSRNDGGSQGTASEKESTQFHGPIRQGWRTTQGDGSRTARGSEDWPVFNRLCSWESGHRGKRNLLAFAARSDGTRQIETTGNGRRWLHRGDSMGEPAPYVVEGTVISVWPGTTQAVYDLTAADGSSFIANGVVVHNCYRENLHSQDVNPYGWLTQEDVEQKRAELTDSMWRTEVELQEPNPKDRAIITDAVDKMFDRKLGYYKPAMGEYIEHEAPTEGGRYSTGCDWAKENDLTVIVTMRYDVKPRRIVAFEYRNRQEWPTMVERFDKRLARYNDDTGRTYSGRGQHDATGIGNVIADYLKRPARGILMVGRERSTLLTDYIAAIEGGEIVSPYIHLAYQEHKMASVSDVFGSGHLPDSISASALAELGASRGGWTRGAG